MKKGLQSLAIAFLSLWSNILTAQIDNTFWFAAPEVYEFGSAILDRDIAFRIATYDLPATVTISQPASGRMPPITFTVPANSTHTENVTAYIDFIESRPHNSVLNKGIHITSSSQISVYYEVITGGAAGGGNNPEAFTLKGENALGVEFYIPGQNLVDNHSSYSNQNFNSFDIVATENGTVVNITPSNNILGHTAAAGTFSVNLNKGQIYSARAASRSASQHLNGSHVSSNKKIAITVKDDLLDGNTHGGNCADLTGDQIVPVHIIGTEYIAINGQLNNPKDFLFITATQDNTQIFRNGASSPLATIHTGQSYQIGMGPSANSTFIRTSKPSYVWQLSGSGCEYGATLLPKINCTGSREVRYIRSSNSGLWFNLLVPTGHESNFLFNGTPVSPSHFSNVTGITGWKFAQISMPITLYPYLGVINVENTSSNFHLSVIDINGGGTSYGYFSDYASFDFWASAYPNPVCQGENIYLFSETIAGATYSWSGPAAFSSTLQNPVIAGATMLNSGVYTVTVTNANGCTSSKTVDVTVNRCDEQCKISVKYCVDVDDPLDYSFVGEGVPSAGGIYTWNFGDGSPLTSTTSGHVSHTFPSPGSFNVAVSFTTSTGAKCEKKFSICIAQPNTSTENIQSAIEVGNIYPNPANSVLNIPLSTNSSNIVVRIISAEGKNMLEEHFEGRSYHGTIDISIESLNTGFYFCEVISDSGREVQKFYKY